MKKVRFLLLINLLYLTFWGGAIAQIKAASNGNVGFGSINNPLYENHFRDAGRTRFEFDHPSWSNISLQIQLWNPNPRIMAQDKVVFYNLANNDHIHVQAKSFFQPSDSTLKENITTLKAKDALDKIMKLNGYSYNWKNDDRKKKQFGLIAQEVKSIIPDMVYESDSTGILGMDYSAIIPYLVEAIHQQQEEIASLRNQQKANSKTANVPEDSANILGDANPNPANDEINIPVTLVTNSADILITNLNGETKLVQSVAGTGEKEVRFSLDKLVKGLYLYSLVVENKVVDTKRLIVQ
jgi:hypothetical protein